MATETDRRFVPAADRAPSSWGMGDGQAIPWVYAPARLDGLIASVRLEDR